MARFVSVDPLAEEFSQLTPFQYASNSPIAGIDLDGLEFVPFPIAPLLSSGSGVALSSTTIRPTTGLGTLGRTGNVSIPRIAGPIPEPIILNPTGIESSQTLSPPTGVEGTTLEAPTSLDQPIELPGNEAIQDGTQIDLLRPDGIVQAEGDIIIEIPGENKIDRGLLNPPAKPGQAPTFKEDGTPVEIHHESQNPKGPFREMHRDDHRGKGNDKASHPNKRKPSKIDRKAFEKARREYWKNAYSNYFSKPK